MSVAPFAPLDPAVYREVVRRALAEDVRWGDVTTEAVVPPELAGAGVLRVGSDCVLAGLEVALECFRQLDPHARVVGARREGEHCEAGQVLAEVHGFAAALLTAEQTARNFLGRLCGIATATRAYVEAGGGRITVLDTRATTPTLRALEAYAVRVGGGVNHRIGLDDGVRVTTSHAALAGDIGEAVRRVRAAGTELPIEVEASTLAAVDVALEAGADTVVLRGLPLAEVREAVARARGRARSEVAGGVPLASIPEFAETGAEYISVAALTEVVAPVEIQFDVAASGGAPSA